ncbi:hypothetical protein BGZ73_001828 [Actinomortierella ambigua]|nr:hypothetical protein BGZ73_001828 [Actinomortierella ambigua]
MKRSASEINAENEALEALLRDRVNSLAERLRVVTQQSKDVHAQAMALGKVFHEKQKRLYQIEDHLLRVQGKPGLSELYLENGSQPRSLTKDLEEFRMGVKTLRRKFQAAGTVVTTAGWWRHLHADSKATDKNASSASTSSTGNKDDKPRSPVIATSPVSLTPTTRQSRPAVSLEIFTSPTSPTSSSFSRPGASSSSLLSPRDGASRDHYHNTPASERANPSLGLRSPPLTPKTTSPANPLYKNLSLTEIDPKRHDVLPSEHGRDDDHDSPVVMMVTATVDAGKDLRPPPPGRPGTKDSILDSQCPQAVTDPHVAPPSPVHSASDVEEKEEEASGHTREELKQSQDSGSDSGAKDTMAVDAHDSDIMETLHNAEITDAAANASSTDTTSATADATTITETHTLNEESEDQIPTPGEGEGEGGVEPHNHSDVDDAGNNDDNNDDNDNHDDYDHYDDDVEDWEEVKDDTPLLHGDLQSSAPDLVSRDQEAQEQAVPKEQLEAQDLGWTQRLWLFLVRIEYIFLGTAVLGTTLPDNPIAFVAGFVSAAIFAVVLVGRWLLGRGGDDEDDDDDNKTRGSKKTHRVIFTTGRSSTPRYRASVASGVNRSPASTLSRRRSP